MGAERCIDGRFDVVRLAGEGGMGRVYEADDRRSGRRVAVKVLRDRSAQASGRFAREVRLLAELAHPGVVRYVVHGVTEEGEPYLAMEWLEGETLSRRLRRAPLDVPEVVALGIAVARALGAVHRAGVVHRDLKPSNIFLVDGAPERAVLLDFGIARVADAPSRLTTTGALLGTPGYMAPEQVRGDRRLDARADLFALGSVLFRCLSGQDAFTGEESLSMMFKVVLEEPPRVAALLPGVPRALDALVAGLLAKERAARPPDADTVAAALEAIEVRALEARYSVPPPGGSPGEITARERRLTALVMVRDGGDGAGHPALLAAVERHQGRIEQLAEGAFVVVLGSTGAPTDLAVRAARCALAVREALGGAAVSLSAGLVEIEARLPVGDMIDRAVRLLATAGAAALVRVDEVTAGLLGERFDVRSDGATLVLHGELEELDTGRRLLGRPTTCLGRERELGLLEALFAHCAEDSAANAALLTGEAGVGKSRVRHELLRRLRERGHRFQAWIGCGDPMSAGSAFAMLARAVRHGAGIGDGDPPAERRDKIRQRALVAAVGPTSGSRPPPSDTRSLDEAARAAVFLGELVGAPFPDEVSAQLRAARADPVLMGDQLRRAAEDLLRAACAEGPVILVLEDLQWGDLPTVTFVDAALRNLADLPLLVLALARPEVEEVFPRLWVDRPTQVVRLPPLPRRAAERIVQGALGDHAPDELVSAVVARAGGNAFYLEELTRAVSAAAATTGGVTAAGSAPERGLGELPETVVAMAQARLEGLDPELRRTLRAASVFGRAFSPGGVGALLGGAAVGSRLANLVAAEIVVRSDEPGLGGEPAYGFRHALVREAAYGMLTAGDRALGHRLAGAFLEREGKGEAIELAEHFERGGEPERAAAFYRRAAEEALAGNDLAAALARAARGAAGGCGSEDLGALRLIEAEAHLWRGELVVAQERAAAAATLLSPGSPAWFRALSHGCFASGKLGAVAGITALTATAVAETPAAGALSAQVRCLCICAGELVFAGRYDDADALLTRIAAAVGEPPSVDPQALGTLAQARAFRAFSAGNLGAALGHFEAALAAFEHAGDLRNACTARSNRGFFFAELGGFAEAEASLRPALAEAERLGLSELAANVQQNLGCVRMEAGQLDEARALELRAVETLKRLGNTRLEGSARVYLARVHLRAGDLASAAREALAAADCFLATPPLRAAAVAVSARAFSRQGRTADALAAAEEAFALLQAAGGSLEEGESLVRLVHVEALAAAGRTAEARAALHHARARLLSRADRIRDPAWRERFLTQVPDNAATLAAVLAPEA